MVQRLQKLFDRRGHGILLPVGADHDLHTLIIAAPESSSALHAILEPSPRDDPHVPTIGWRFRRPPVAPGLPHRRFGKPTPAPRPKFGEQKQNGHCGVPDLAFGQHVGALKRAGSKLFGSSHC